MQHSKTGKNMLACLRTCSVKSEMASAPELVYVAVISVEPGAPAGLANSKATRSPCFSHAVMGGNWGLSGAAAAAGGAAAGAPNSSSSSELDCGRWLGAAAAT